jgi:SAM-dependent methyltransferase
VERDARRFFDAIARRYDRIYALPGAVTRARMERVLEAIAGRARVLVLGIGTGRELPALLDAGHTVSGLDVSKEMVAICERRSRTVPITLGDFWKPLPFADGAFDAVIALHGTLAHPPEDDAEKALGVLARELARVLALGGVLVAEVPAAEGLSRLGEHAHGGLHLDVTGARTFVHEDRVAGVALAGVALEASAWQRALAPHLEAAVSPLGEAEHLVVATRGDPSETR